MELLIGITVGVLLLVVAGVVFMYLRRPGAGRVEQDLSGIYLPKDALLSEAERQFYDILVAAVNGRCWVFPKVRLSEMVQVRGGLGRSQGQAAFNRISRKHIDFVLCTWGDYRVLALVVLDDNSSRSQDGLVDQIVTDAGLPIVHFQVDEAYDVETVAAMIPGLDAIEVSDEAEQV